MFFAGLNAAAAEYDLPVQFCMMQPSDILNTLLLDQVTNGRASGDYAGNGNWNLGRRRPLESHPPNVHRHDHFAKTGSG